MPGERPFVGALALELLDDKGERIAANYVNLIARSVSPGAIATGSVPASQSPRVEVLGPRLVAVRLDPDDFAVCRPEMPKKQRLQRRGKFVGHGDCEVQYDVTLPEFVRAAVPSQVVLMAELATKTDAEKLDWPAVRRKLDYPQTEERKYPGTVSVRLADRPLWRFDLPDDPADSRGVLSHQQRDDHGSYGYLVRKKVDLTRDIAFREKLRSSPTVSLVFRAVGESTESKTGGHGLSLFGERLGRYPIDPTLIIETGRDVTRPKGWKSTEPVTVNRRVDKVD